jgi:hypothetical protein
VIKNLKTKLAAEINGMDTPVKDGFVQNMLC